MEAQVINHYQIGTKYRIKLERAASTKGVIGYVIEVNSDNRIEAENEIDQMRRGIEALCPMPIPVEAVK